MILPASISVSVLNNIVYPPLALFCRYTTLTMPSIILYRFYIMCHTALFSAGRRMCRFYAISRCIFNIDQCQAPDFHTPQHTAVFAAPETTNTLGILTAFRNIARVKCGNTFFIQQAAKGNIKPTGKADLAARWSGHFTNLVNTLIKLITLLKAVESCFSPNFAAFFFPFSSC
ncbi:hypothetical protein ABIE50_004922 [Chitinophaga sp. OAE865]